MLTRRHLLASTSSVLASSAAVAALGGPAFAQSGATIKIGAILPSSGILGSYGILYRSAIQMAVEDINAAGGINGAKVELLAEDDQAQPNQSVLLFRKLVNDGAAFVVGPVTGTSWENTAPIANAMKVPAICWTALKSGISRKPYALRIHPPNDTMIPEGMAEIKKIIPNLKRIVVVGDEREASTSEGIKLWAAAAKANGIEVLETIGFQTGTTDFSPLAIKVRGHNPDALFFSALGPPALALVKEMETQGFDKPMVGDSTVWAGGSFIQAVGSAGKNLHTLGFSTNETWVGNDKYNNYVQRFIKRTEETTNLPRPINVCNTSLAYDAVMMGADLLRKGGVNGSTAPAAARDAVKNGLDGLKKYDGVNAITMRDSGDGHIQAHVLKAAPEEKIWKFVLPPDQRLNTPATPMKL
ncbi:MAG: branched-chain amino acid abc transporter, amino acid-binding protein [Hyphomicrobiales bacterium]|nr:branched-chain amino acid abc transporter, amino acid-binding protein [Hyphomicrobiales bacterium]